MKNKEIESSLQSNLLIQLKDLFIFIVLIFFFFLIVDGLEQKIIRIPFVTALIDFLSMNILHITSWFLSHVAGISNSVSGYIITLQNGAMLEMQYGCSGYKQIVLLLLLFICIRGSWKQKIWYIPVSIIALHILNTLRFIGIAISLEYYPQHFHFIHDWIFRPFIYLAIFMLWVIWVEYIAKRKTSKEESSIQQKS